MEGLAPPYITWQWERVPFCQLWVVMIFSPSPRPGSAAVEPAQWGKQASHFNNDNDTSDDHNTIMITTIQYYPLYDR